MLKVVTYHYVNVTVDMMAGEFDPTAAITSWRYQVEQEAPYISPPKEGNAWESQAIRVKTITVYVLDYFPCISVCLSILLNVILCSLLRLTLTGEFSVK